MNTQKKNTFWLLPLLLALLPLSAFSQEEKGRFLDKWAVGAGYNFLHREKIPLQKRTFEISVKYRHTDKHSFYLTAPLYFENNKDEQKIFKLSDYNDPWIHRIWGIGVGYDYTVFEWKGFSGFGGIGFDFKKDRSQEINYYYASDESGNKYEDHYFQEHRNKVYGLTPQVGLSYKWRHIGCDLKYTFSVCLDVYETDINSDGSSMHKLSGYDDFVRSSCRCIHGLSASLFYYF